MAAGILRSIQTGQPRLSPSRMTPNGYEINADFAIWANPTVSDRQGAVRMTSDASWSSMGALGASSAGVWAKVARRSSASTANSHGTPPEDRTRLKLSSGL